MGAVLSLTFSPGLTAEVVCTKRPVSLRLGRSPSSAISWQVGRDMPLKRLEKQRDWSHVGDLEGETHWIPNSELNEKAHCAVVRTNVVGLHAAPLPNSPPLAFKTLDRFTPLKRVAQQREWVQVEDDSGRKAWINQSQLWP